MTAASVYTIAPRLPFLDCVAARLLDVTRRQPEALAATTILLPTRRSQSTLREAFLRVASGQSLLLPRMLAVSDLDEAEITPTTVDDCTPTVDILPAMSPSRRLALLTRLVTAAPAASGVTTTGQAARLARELALLLDQMHTAGVSFDRLSDLAPDRHADHWRTILDFLKIVTVHWPKLLQQEGCLNPAERRDLLLRTQAKIWSRHPPSGPVIAAGTSGEVPAVAELMAVVANLPDGAVVLPGLDRHLDPDSWNMLDDSHPQLPIKRFLERVGLTRDHVADWPVSIATHNRANPARERLVSEALRPAATTERWRTIPPLPKQAVLGMSHIDCPTPREEALVIALILRQALETPGRTAALATPDRDLARRVAAELQRWGINVDDSAGRPFAVTPPGSFLRLSAAMIDANFMPVPTLAALKHPLCAAGLAVGDFRDRARRLEITALRGPAPQPGLSGLRAAINADATDLHKLINALEARCAPLITAMHANTAPFRALLEAHLGVAEALAEQPKEPGSRRLWAEDAGHQGAAFLGELSDCAGLVGDIPPSDYADLLDVFMHEHVVRPSHGTHPRIAIRGLLETRLNHADLLLIGGLNEDVWPSQPNPDPWMNRSMRAECGLPAPEQVVGSAAHDFAAALCAPTVVMTRSEKIGGVPTTPSRWLARLETVMRAADLEPLRRSSPWLRWAQRVDMPTRFERPTPPAPRPPLRARPKKLPATQIEIWMRDPYAIYARYILSLRPLPPLDAEPDAAEYGSLVHNAFERFSRCCAHALPDDPLSELLNAGRAAFEAQLARPSARMFWWPRFQRLARWAADQETARRQQVRQTYPEVKGKLDLDGLTLTATADRVDVMNDGTLAIIDYKTGTLPPHKEVAAGRSPQLPLEGLIACGGGFQDIPSQKVSQLLYWHLSGSGEGGKEKTAVPKGTTVDALIDDALSGLRALIDAFDRPGVPYEARPHPEHAPRYSDYTHLARIREWAAGHGGKAET